MAALVIAAGFGFLALFATGRDNYFTPHVASWRHRPITLLRSSRNLSGYRYRLHDIEGTDLGEVMHPAPNLEPGDTVTTKDGGHWRVTRYVPALPEAPMRRLLEVERHE